MSGYHDANQRALSRAEAAYLDPPDEPEACPRCGANAIEEDKHERSIECMECGYSDGYDWDAAAEAAQEAREMDDPGLETW